MSLIILTKSPKISLFSQESYKRILAKILNRNRGPKAVTSSLLRGLKSINYPYKLNPRADEINDDDTIWVNESLEALKWAVKSKENNKLIIGPNLVITPLDRNGIICDDSIDIILQPSEWTKNFYISIKPALSEKIKVWPAGVEIPDLIQTPKIIDVLIYIKNYPKNNLLEKIKMCLINKNMTFDLVVYGKFKQSDYFNKLQKSKSLIYISNSESQGLSIQEAWARNIPTLALDQNIFKYKQYHFPSIHISAPYLNDQAGMFFNFNNFNEVFAKFWNNLNGFTPREYVINNLSDKVCAQKFINIINGSKR